MFQETKVLPISIEDANSSFQIIIPTFIAQLTIIFKWFASPPNETLAIDLPKWVVYGPPILSLIVLIGSLVLIVSDNGESLNGGQIFKNIVTFIVSVLGATTVFIITRVFGENGKNQTNSNGK